MLCHFRTTSWLVVQALLILVLSIRAASAADSCSKPAIETLTVENDRFLINGAPEFLPFVTYFDALRTSPAQWDIDLNYFCAHGIRGVRIFANWGVNSGRATFSTVVNRNGTLVLESRTEQGGQHLFRAMSVLDDFLNRARSKGIVVDLVFDRDIGLASPQAWADAVLNVVSYYAGAQSHLMLDVSNEYPAHGQNPCDLAYLMTGKTDVTMPSYGPACARTLKLSSNIRAIDPRRIVTASADPGGIVNVFGVPESRMSPLAAAVAYATVMGLDVITFHDGRPGRPNETRGWPARTGTVVDALREHAAAAPRPIFLDEPCRVGNTASTRHCPTAANAYVQAATHAREHGAAAWTYHTEAGMGPYSASQGFVSAVDKSLVDKGVIGAPRDNGARTPLVPPR